MAAGVNNSGNCTNAPVTGKYYVVKNQGSNKVLDISRASNANVANVIQYRHHGRSNQRFNLTDLGNGYWSIMAAHSGKSLDVAAWGAEDGDNIQQYEYHGGNNQQWQLKQSSSDGFNIVSHHSGKSLTVTDDSRSNVYQKGDTGSPYQRWYFNPVDGDCPSDGDSSTSNSAPVAKVSAVSQKQSGDSVTLDGSGSSDPDGDNLTYRWTQTQGSTISLSNNTDSTLKFIAPNVDQSTTFTFQLTVNDGELSDSASVQLQVSPNADTCATVDEGESLTLSCPSGQVVTGVEFASYGTPSGSCGSFSNSQCNASNSVSVVKEACVGMASCTVKANNSTFGDPCYGTYKKLSAQVTCGTATEDTTPTPTPTPEPVSDTDTCPTELVGFASVNANGLDGTTGGGNATPTTVTTLSELKAAAKDSSPRVIIVSGTIDTGTDAVSIASNKTIKGIDKNATIIGGLDMRNVSNIIIRNLNIRAKSNRPVDTIASRNSHHIWYDHLNVSDASDGLLDITIKSNYQTVSWSKFSYSDKDAGHRLASLNGSGGGSQPDDYGKLKITYHHNWWGDLVDQRMPRVMYGQGHEFNNYFTATGNYYCIGVGSYGSILVENNYFKDVNNPHMFMYNAYMYSAAKGNIYDNTTGKRDTGLGGSEHVSGQESYKGEACTTPYQYTMDAAKDVPDLVKRCAGPQ
jgi:pectate lyase